jgi:electron transport complex protein RnfC
MNLKTFKGGIHPPERKAPTEGKLIVRIPTPKQVAVPVNQHFGAPNKPTVKVGDAVKRGQVIADGEGKMCVPVHASIAGTVKKVEPRNLSNNTYGLCVVIEGDGSDATEFLPPLDAFACTKEEALARLRAAGLVGMGGAAFPVHVKLSPPPNKPIALAIANAAECEPYLTIDEATMIEEAAKVVEGLAIVMRTVGAPKGVFGLEDNKRRLIPVLEKAIAERGRGLDISVQLVKTKYPQGGEKMLISALTGKEVPSGGLPMDVGCVVHNVGTLKAIAEAFAEGKPLIERGLSVAGGAASPNRDLLAPIGTLASDLPADLVAVDSGKLALILFGGPMMGTAVPGLDIPIQKNTSGIVLMTAAEAALDHAAILKAGAPVEGPCIRCGRCLRACACRLSPVIMNGELDAGRLEKAADIGLLDCIECGSCSYVCPARIELVQRFKVGKQLLRNARAAAAAVKG